MPQTLGQIEVTFEFSRHVGPRFVHGGVTLSFDALKPYSFSSHATWPTGDCYESAVRSEVESVLIEKLGSLESVQVVLKSVSWHPVNSCQVGFQRAARAAALAAFSV
jgi:hypothetical protein